MYLKIIFANIVSVLFKWQILIPMKNIKHSVLMILMLLPVLSFSQFAENKGQIADFDQQIRNEFLFYLQTQQMDIYFRKDGITYIFKKGDVMPELASFLPEEQIMLVKEHMEKQTLYYRLDVDFAGKSQQMELRGSGKAGYYQNFYYAHCPDGVLNVQSYERIRYENVYQNIDFEFYLSDDKFKYDVIVNPGGDIRNIRLRFNGAHNIKLDNNELIIDSPVGPIVESLPESFVISERGDKKQTFVKYELKGDEVHFLADYPRNEKLLIDPQISWTTYYDDCFWNGSGSRIDVKGNQVLIVSYGFSALFPTLNPGGSAYYQNVVAGSGDYRILKFDADGVRIWATYYGGTGYEHTADVCVDYNTNIIVVGHTESNNIPTQTAGGYFDNTYGSGGGTFIMKFNSGGVRQWATHYDYVHYPMVEIDHNSNVYVLGRSGTTDPSVLALAGAYNQALICHDAGGGHSNDMFIIKFGPTTTRIWATNLGGSCDEFLQDVRCGADNSLNIVGYGDNYYGVGIVTYNPGGGAYYDNTLGIGGPGGGASDRDDALIYRFNANGALIWGTAFSGTLNENMQQARITTDNSNNIIIYGETRSTNLPFTNPGGGAYFDNTFAAGGSGFNPFIARFSSGGVLNWCTYFGSYGLGYGMNFSNFLGVTTDNKLIAIVTDGGGVGGTHPVVPRTGDYNAPLSVYMGVYIAEFAANLSIAWSTYYAGATDRHTLGDAVLSSNSCGYELYLTSNWEKYNVAATDPPWEKPLPTSYQNTTFFTTGNRSGLISRFSNASSTPPTGISAVPASICLGSSTTLTLSGGSLGTGAAWYWYTGSCGGTLIGTGNSISVSPSSTTTYYVRAEGTCNMTSCASTTVTVSAPPTTGLINGDYVWWPRTSNDWGVTTNWLVYNGSVFQIPAGPPTSTNNVFILTDVGCVATWPTIFAAAYCRSLTIGTGAQLTISASNTLDVYGNWTNSGSFFCNTSRVNFLGAVNATITGTTTFYDLVMNKGTGTTYLLNVNSPITVSHNAITALGFTNGLMTVNAGGSLTLAAGQTISSTAGLHFNGGNLVAGNYSLTNQGYFRISSGTVNLGNSTGNSFNAQNGSTNIISGGAFNIAARMAFTGTASLTVSGGTINLCQVENTSATATWHMDANASLNMSSGSLLLNQPAIGTGYDVNLLAGAGAKSISGGSVQFGVAATALSAAFRVSNPATPFFNLIVFRCGILTLMSPVSANAVVTFTNGHVVSSAVNYFNFNDGASWSGASNSSFVNGPVRKTGDDAFVFPTGDVQGASNVFARLAIADPGSTVTDAFTAEYFFLPSPNNWDPAFLCTGVHHASGIEYWNIERNAGTTYPAVTLYWDNGTRSGITSLADLTVVHMENCGGTNKWVDKGGSTTGTTAAGTITSTLAFPSYSPVTFGSKTGTNPLPVSLTSFYAQCQDQRVTLYWTTLSETNSDYFEVLCSTDGDSWTPLGRLTAAGYSNEPRFYSYTDPLLRESLHHYRLIQADFDGTHYEIPAIAVNCYGGSPADIIVYPNPFNGWVSIIIPENMILINWSLTDVAGKLVDAGIPAEGNGIHTLNIPGLSRGVYFLSLTTGSEVKRFKLVRE